MKEKCELVLCVGHVGSVSPVPPSSLLSHRGNFLRNLAATQWEKKRRSKHLSQSRLSSSDDLITPGPQLTAEEGRGVPAAETSLHSKFTFQNKNMLDTCLYTVICEEMSNTDLFLLFQHPAVQTQTDSQTPRMTQVRDSLPTIPFSESNLHPQTTDNWIGMIKYKNDNLIIYLII